MSNPEIISETPMNLVQVKDELQKIHRKEKELNYRAGKTYEHLKTAVKLSVKEAEELYASIEKLNIPRLKDIYIHKIIDVIPVRMEEVKIILQDYPITVSQENMKKIAEVVSQYQKEK